MVLVMMLMVMMVMMVMVMMVMKMMTYLCEYFDACDSLEGQQHEGAEREEPAERRFFQPLHNRTERSVTLPEEHKHTHTVTHTHTHTHVQTAPTYSLLVGQRANKYTNK